MAAAGIGQGGQSTVVVVLLLQAGQMQELRDHGGLYSDSDAGRSVTGFNVFSDELQSCFGLIALYVASPPSWNGMFTL